MAMSSDEEEELFDVGLNSDHASLISPKEKENDSDVMGTPVHNKRIFKTVVLFSSFISLGLAVAILGPTIPNLILQVGTGYSQLSFIFLTRGFGYMVGAVIAGFVIERLNPFRVLGCSLALCAVAMFLMPAVTSLNLLILLFVLAGFSMGCMDTGGNVLCIQIWGPKSPPYMQALHFSFAVGALVAPLVAKPFIGLPFSGNETALDVVCQLSQSETSHNLITEHVDSTILPSGSSLTLMPTSILTRQGLKINTVHTTITTEPVIKITTKPVTKITTKPIPTTTKMDSTTMQPILTRHSPTDIQPIYTTTEMVPTTTEMVPTTTETVPTTTEMVPTTTEMVPTTTETVPTTTEIVPTTGVISKLVTTLNPTTTRKLNPSPKLFPTTTEQVPTTDEIAHTNMSPDLTTHERIPTKMVTTIKVEPIVKTTPQTNSINTKIKENPKPDDKTNLAVGTNSSFLVTDNSQQKISNHSQNIETDTKVSLVNNTNAPSKLNQSSSADKLTPTNTVLPEKPKNLTSTTAEDSLQSTSEVGMSERMTAQELVSDIESINISTIDSQGSIVEESQGSTVGRPNKPKRRTVKEKATQKPKHIKHPKSRSVKTVFQRDVGWMSNEDLTTNKTGGGVDGAKLWNVYGILFFVITLNSIAFFYLSFKAGHYKHSHYTSASKSLAHQNDSSFRLQLLSIMFVFYFLYVGSEVAYGSFIFSYGRFSALKLDKDQASLLNSLYWGTFAAFRGLAIFVARCSSPLVMLLFDLFGCGVASIILLIFKGSNSVALWAGTAALGASMASLFPSGLSWLERYIKVTGSAASVLVVGASAGEMTIPFFVGYFFPDWCHPENEGKNIQVLMYTMCAVTLFTSIIFLMAYQIAKKKGDRYKHHHPVPESSIMLELQSTE